MSIKIKKKAIITVVAIIIIIAIIVGAVFLAPVIKTKIAINNNKNILKNINAEEFENAIIEELKNTKIYLTENDTTDNYKYKTRFEKSKTEYIVANIETALVDSNTYDCVTIPCFKIEKDNKGMFKSIKYVASSDIENIQEIIEKSIKNVLENKYNVNIKYFNYLKDSTNLYDKDCWITADTFLEIYQVLDGISNCNTEEKCDIKYDEVTNTCTVSQGVFIFGIDIK